MNLTSGFNFNLPTTIQYGVGAVSTLGGLLSSKHAERVLIVTDKGIRRAGIIENVTGTLDRAGVKWEIYDEVEPNPKDYNVQNGAEIAAAVKADYLVAVGGGSPIDCAKAMAVVAVHKGAIRDYEGPENIPGDVLPIIAVPSTAGSASEVTFSAVITDVARKYKFSLRSTRIAPEVALCDPEMTVAMPAALTAATGMDALTHAVEGYTALASNALADAAALHAIELISGNLKTAVADGSNMAARAGMLLGSILGGIAFSHSDVASVHCIAEALGGMYDAPHGVCNAVVLPEMMAYNMAYCRDKYARIAVAMGIYEDDPDAGARKAVDAVRQLAADINLPRFRDIGVREADVERLAENSAINGSNVDNPRPMAKADYVKVLRSMMNA
ncbi:MAG: iron-containing alcohol dehydrogenase [Desulfobacteraceae bacterium]|nr:iron-containing alcohol dehydrogenase [Desulfobacteraceae bacterium]